MAWKEKYKDTKKKKIVSVTDYISILILQSTPLVAKLVVDILDVTIFFPRTGINVTQTQ